MPIKRAIEVCESMIDYGWGFSDDEIAITIPALETAIQCMEILETIQAEALKVSDEVKHDYVLNPDILEQIDRLIGE